MSMLGVVTHTPQEHLTQASTVWEAILLSEGNTLSTEELRRAVQSIRLRAKMINVRGGTMGPGQG